MTQCRGIPYQQLLQLKTDEHLGYLYASKRYFIPFGWYTNPIQSMASTTWVLMPDYNFNPFSPEFAHIENGKVIYNHYPHYSMLAHKPEKISDKDSGGSSGIPHDMQITLKEGTFPHAKVDGWAMSFSTSAHTGEFEDLGFTSTLPM